jgi:hypothetical protein
MAGGAPDSGCALFVCPGSFHLSVLSSLPLPFTPLRCCHQLSPVVIVVSLKLPLPVLGSFLSSVVSFTFSSVILLVILFEPSAKIIFPQPNFKPSTHFTYSHTYLPISEVSAYFPVISCPISNFKRSMTQFTVQTSFSRRWTSVSQNSQFLYHNSMCMYLFRFHILTTM